MIKNPTGGQETALCGRGSISLRRRLAWPVSGLCDSSQQGQRSSGSELMFGAPFPVSSPARSSVIVSEREGRKSNKARAPLLTGVTVQFSPDRLTGPLCSSAQLHDDATPEREDVRQAWAGMGREKGPLISISAVANHVCCQIRRPTTGENKAEKPTGIRVFDECAPPRLTACTARFHSQGAPICLS